MPKFTIEEHEKRMRELLMPKPQVGSALLTKFKEVANKRKAGGFKPPVTQQEG